MNSYSFNQVSDKYSALGIVAAACLLAVAVLLQYTQKIIRIDRWLITFDTLKGTPFTNGSPAQAAYVCHSVVLHGGFTAYHLAHRLGYSLADRIWKKSGATRALSRALLKRVDLAVTGLALRLQVADLNHSVCDCAAHHYLHFRILVDVTVGDMQIHSLLLLFHRRRVVDP